MIEVITTNPGDEGFSITRRLHNREVLQCIQHEISMLLRPGSLFFQKAPAESVPILSYQRTKCILGASPKLQRMSLGDIAQHVAASLPDSCEQPLRQVAIQGLGLRKKGRSHPLTITATLNSDEIDNESRTAQQALERMGDLDPRPPKHLIIRLGTIAINPISPAEQPLVVANLRDSLSQLTLPAHGVSLQPAHAYLNTRSTPEPPLHQ